MFIDKKSSFRSTAIVKKSALCEQRLQESENKSKKAMRIYSKPIKERVQLNSLKKRTEITIINLHTGSSVLKPGLFFPISLSSSSSGSTSL